MRSLSLLPVFLIAASLNAQAQLDIEVELARADAGGTVRLALCMGKEAYDREKGCMVLSGTANGSLVRLAVPQLPPGRYAIKAFHDVNDNGEMDFNWAGIPKEPYGFSNNATGVMAAPKFEQAAFNVKPGANMVRFRIK